MGRLLKSSPYQPQGGLAPHSTFHRYAAVATPTPPHRPLLPPSPCPMPTWPCRHPRSTVEWVVVVVVEFMHADKWRLTRFFWGPTTANSILDFSKLEAFLYDARQSEVLQTIRAPLRSRLGPLVSVFDFVALGSSPPSQLWTHTSGVIIITTTTRG